MQPFICQHRGNFLPCSDVPRIVETKNGSIGCVLFGHRLFRGIHQGAASPSGADHAPDIAVFRFKRHIEPVADPSRSLTAHLIQRVDRPNPLFNQLDRIGEFVFLQKITVTVQYNRSSVIGSNRIAGQNR